MRIEKFNKSDMEKMSDLEIHALRNQFSQIHSKFWEAKSWPAMSREEFIAKYADLAIEMDRRDIRKTTSDIDVSLFGLHAERIASGESMDLVQEGSRTIKRMIVKKADSDDPERIVFGIVAEPDEKDSEGDWETEDDIREALYYFMEHDGIFKMNHSGGSIDVNLLEAFIAPVDYSIEGESVKKGSWVQGVRVDVDTFDKIEKGELTGFSMAGTAIRIEDDNE